MSGEAKLREALAPIFDPYDWCNGDDDSQCWVNPAAILDEVVSRLKDGEWLITGGIVHHLHFAWHDGPPTEHYEQYHQPWRACTDD
jgi:hypothetical protein